jgi:hypothetical protein
MIHPAVSMLAERNMTRARILDQAAAAASRPGSTLTRPGPRTTLLATPGSAGWACRLCGDAWHGTPPETHTCPGGCTPAPASPQHTHPSKEHQS